MCTPCLSESSHTPQSRQHTGHISGRQWRHHSVSWPSQRLHFSPKTHKEDGRCRRPRNAAVSCGDKDSGPHQHWRVLKTHIHQEMERNNRDWWKECKYLPAVTVWCTDIGPDAYQKVYNYVVTPADGIVKSGDAFVVGLARVSHLQKDRFSYS